MNDILELSDAILIKKYLQKRNPLYLEILLRRYNSIINSGIKSVLMSYSFDKDTAADIRDEAFQNTCLQVIRKIDRLRKPEKFGSWLREISVNITRNEIRKRLSRDQRQVSISTQVNVGHYSPPDPNDELELLQKFANTLSPRLRKTLNLYLEEKTHREMAEILGISEGSATQYVFRMKRKLKVFLERRKRC